MSRTRKLYWKIRTALGWGPRAAIYARVVRADGRVEELGLIAIGETHFTPGVK
jgi:hypothetical protein